MSAPYPWCTHRLVVSEHHAELELVVEERGEGREVAAARSKAAGERLAAGERPPVQPVERVRVLLLVRRPRREELPEGRRETGCAGQELRLEEARVVLRDEILEHARLVLVARDRPRTSGRHEGLGEDVFEVPGAASGPRPSGRRVRRRAHPSTSVEKVRGKPEARAMR